MAGWELKHDSAYCKQQAGSGMMDLPTNMCVRVE